LILETNVGLGTFGELRTDPQKQGFEVVPLGKLEPEKQLRPTKETKFSSSALQFLEVIASSLYCKEDTFALDLILSSHQGNELNSVSKPQLFKSIRYLR
jgi:hypothetical protein